MKSKPLTPSAVSSALAFFIAAALLALAAPAARAETGVTNIINGVTTSAAGAYYVGDTGPFNGLIITNAGMLMVTNISSADVSIGNTAAASNNFALVTGPGSVWTNAGGNGFNVGYSGAGNRLIVTNGGVVVSDFSCFVGRNPSSSNNTVVVSGSGSLWTSLSDLWGPWGRIYVGLSGGGNQLLISDAGQVVDAIGYMGDSSDNNAVTVTGSGSLWNNTNSLHVGSRAYSSTGNQLTISDGGRVANLDGYVGHSSNAANNAVTVSGGGSVWSNSGSLHIGYYGSGNSLTVTNDGAVTVADNAYVGVAASASNNTITLAGGTLAVTNTLDVRGGTLTFNGGNLSANTLRATNNTASATNSIFNFNYGTLTTRAGAQIVAPGNFIIGNTPSQTATWNILGGTNSVEFVTGGPGTFLGGVAGAAGNVTVTGAGTVWTNASVVVVGWSGSGSQLTITNGGQVFNASGFLGYNAGADNNAATITGAGSVWSNNNLTIGVYGAGNQLTILNSGLVVNAEGYVGRQTSATNNAVTVSGVGAVWSNASHLYLGEMGSGNQLTITDGGLVVNANGYVGYNGGASNAATVTGSGSVWNNTNTLYVGYNGVGNQLTVANGGQVQDIKGDIGYDGAGNRVLVTGANSLWTNSGILVVGDQTAGNQLTITDSGRVVNAAGSLGYNAGADNNMVIVSGTGSVWNSSSELHVGESGAGNQLIVTNGGQVANDSGFLGYYASASNNAATVSGSGSVWSNAHDLNVGYRSSGNQLIITNGGRVVNSAGYVGYYASASNNAATVTGNGSVWSNASMNVGQLSAGNRLTITNGGQVTAASANVGNNGVDNVAIVSGTGSVWKITQRLAVGAAGWNNQLTINDGGAVLASNVVMGSLNTSTGNVLTVAGGSLTATNAGGTGSLDVRRGTLTLNGGTVAVDRFLATNNASSVVQFSAGLLRSGGTTVSNDVPFLVGDGVQSATYDMLGGTHLFADGLSISSNSFLIGNGGIFGDVTDFGIISPGHSIGTIDITGGLTLTNSSKLDFEIAGAGSNDKLDLTGLLKTGGELKLTFTNGYTGNVGDTFDLLNFGSLSGAFSQTNLPTLGPGMEWNTGQLYSQGSIGIVPEPGTWALLAAGLAGVATRRRKR